MPLSLFMGEKSGTGAGETEARFQKAEAQRQDGLGRLTRGGGGREQVGTSGCTGRQRMAWSPSGAGGVPESGHGWGP